MLLTLSGSIETYVTIYKGQWIDTGNATIGRINPLQVLDNNFKELDEATTENFDEINEAPVSNHLRTLTQWFRTLYHDLKERELRVLINEIQKTYTKFQITNATDISKFKTGQFPTFQNLYETICHSYQEKPNKTLNEIKEMINFDFLGDGQYSKLWNGHTTLAINNQFVVYDVWTLFDQDIPKITAAQLYLVLAFIKGEVKRNRFKKDKELIIVIDEVHLAIDKDNPVAFNFMYQMVKRFAVSIMQELLLQPKILMTLQVLKILKRKRQLWLITHNILLFLILLPVI